METNTKVWHRLSDVNEGERTAVCSVCGPTRIHIRRASTGRAECMTKRREGRATEDPDKKRARAARRRTQPGYDERQRAHSIRWRGRVFGWEPDFDVDDYDRLLTAQGGLCAICKSPPADLRLAIDHDHSTGKVRGLLCMTCNLVLGRFRDDPARFREAAAYLEGAR